MNDLSVSWHHSRLHKTNHHYNLFGNKALVPSKDGEKFESLDTSLLAAVKYWMCDVFKVAKDIYPERHENYYKILLITENGVTATIKHVGFGISQLLPIVVEGLIMPVNGTLILEQPEIHLHPKFQSLLFDFLYSLTLQGKTVIVETHSDHLITRLRRRVAEDVSDSMSDKINLTFIETRNSENLFRTIGLDDYGTFNFFPEDFIDQFDVELRAILEAQMRKSLREQKESK